MANGIVRVGLVGAGGDADAIHMTVDGVEADIGLAPGKPFVEGRVAVVEHLTRRRDPVDEAGRLPPERLRVRDARGDHFSVALPGVVVHGFSIRSFRTAATRVRPLRWATALVK